MIDVVKADFGLRAKQIRINQDQLLGPSGESESRKQHDPHFDVGGRSVALPPDTDDSNRTV